MRGPAFKLDVYVIYLVFKYRCSLRIVLRLCPWKNNALVFSVFIMRSFTVNQLAIWFIAAWILSFKDLRFLSMSNMFVSSANRTIFASWTAVGESLINNINSRGPRTEPCGTPYFNSFHYEVNDIKLEVLASICCIWTNCDLPVRYELFKKWDTV
jgi:hypothetical protein